MQSLSFLPCLLVCSYMAPIHRKYMPMGVLNVRSLHKLCVHRFDGDGDGGGSGTKVLLYGGIGLKIDK